MRRLGAVLALVATNYAYTLNLLQRLDAVELPRGGPARVLVEKIPARLELLAAEDVLLGAVS